MNIILRYPLVMCSVCKERFKDSLKRHGVLLEHRDLVGWNTPPLCWAKY